MTMAAMASEGFCCDIYGILSERACKATDRTSLPMLIFLHILSSLTCFPGRCWAVSYTPVPTQRQSSGIPQRKKKIWVLPVLAVLLVLQVVMLKGQGTPIVWLYQSQAD